MKYFTIQELCNSKTAQLKHIDNSPSLLIQAKLVNLINNLYSALKKITLENRESETQEFKNLNKRIVELEEKVMKDLEQLKNKKGINF